MAARKREAGFTLIEILVVMAIIATLLTLVAPRYFNQTERAKEAVLRQDLSVMRDAIDKHYADVGVYPESLDALVSGKYLRRLPADPLTGSADSWLVVPPGDPAQGAVFDVKSGSPAHADW